MPGTLRSIPPVMITSIWPSAAMARNVPNGAIELRAGPFSVAGAQIAATTTSNSNAMYTGMYREATTNEVTADDEEVVLGWLIRPLPVPRRP